MAPQSIEIIKYITTYLVWLANDTFPPTNPWQYFQIQMLLLH
jgi:hypothetical protein